MKLIRKPGGESENVSVGNYLFKLIPYWRLFLVLAVVSILGAWIYLQYKTPLYETTARILLREDKKDAQDSKSFESMDVISPKRTVDNEAEVIKSTDIINNVVNDLGLYAPVYQKDGFKQVLAYSSSPVLITTNDVTTLKRTPKIPFTLKDSTLIINHIAYPLNRLLQTPYGNLRFQRNPHVAGFDADNDGFYFALLSPKKVVENIADNLDVSINNKQSTIIDLVLKDEDPARGEAILNDLIKFYNISIEKEKNQLAANTAEFIDERLKTVENNLLQIEHQQQAYRSNRGAIDVGTQGKLYLENVSNNDQKSGEINMQLSVLKQVEGYVKSKSLANGIVPSTVGVSDPGLTNMVKNIYELQLQRESLKKTTGENNPAVLSLNDQIEKIRPQILENLENQRQSLEASRKNIAATNQGYSSQLQAIPETEKKLVDINRELNLKSDIYTFLLQKKEETALSFIANGSSNKVINQPESSDQPVTPKRKMVYLGSFFIAMLLGLGFASGRESLRNKIMYQSDIEKLTILPVIGEITAGNAGDVIVIGNKQRTLIAEQFRRLRVTLSYLGVGESKKRILITSAISGEGKSFVAINLAMSLALTDKKVALLDFDLNNPSLHLKFKVNKGIGIAEFLKGEVSAGDIIKQSAINENLYFISAGSTPENPSELITNGKAEELLDYLNTVFDFVIVDVAPVGPISDAYILSPLCDATLYIIRHAYTPKAFVERIDKNNLLNNLKNAAIVFNDVSSRNFSNYGYGYGYGNGYGENEVKRLR